MFNPVANVNVGGGTERTDDGGVAVAEEKVVVWLHAGIEFLLLHLFAVLVDVFSLVAEIAVVGKAVFAAAAVRPAVGDGEADVGMYAGKEPLVQTAAEDALQAVVLAVALAQSVAVSQ